jgi:hypothetical protein
MDVRSESAVASAEIGFEIPKIGVEISFEANAGIIGIRGSRNSVSQCVGLSVSNRRKNHEQNNDASTKRM